MTKLKVEGERVLVRQGPFFRVEIPRGDIVGVRVMRPSLWAGIGVHWFAGAWVVNSRLGDAVELTMHRPVRGHLLGVPVRVRRLQVVVRDPHEVERRLLASSS